MADVPAFDPGQPFETVGAPAFDPSKPFEDATKPASTSNSWAAPITDIPHEAYAATADAVKGAASGLNPFSPERMEAAKKGEFRDPFGLEVGKGLLSAASIPIAPIVGAARSLIGHPFSWLMPKATPEKQKQLRDMGVPESSIPGSTTEENYQKAKGDVDTAMSALAPSRGGLSTIRGPAPVPPAPVPNGPLGVTLSEGQETGKLPLIQQEQAAIRGQMGDAAQTRAQEFVNQQKAEVASAQERIAQGFDPFNATIAETPQEAGALISDSLQTAAAQRKAGVKQAYDTAKSYPGEIHADAFRDMGNTIKNDLTNRPEPVIIDDKLTPYASRAIQDIDDRVSKLFIQNKADPMGPPNPQNITGINLQGVDQMRKRLSAMRKDAFSSGNAADGRATASVLDGFDTQIDNAINNGLFKGDPRAVQAWNDARAAYADYRRTFTAGKNDPTGRVVEKILGKANNPAAIPNDVADFMYGSSGVNPSSLNVNVVNRIKGILGDRSPEWSATKQGLFSRLTEPPPGVTDWGPGKVAQRINRFLSGDGKEMAQAVFSPAERDLIQQYADLQRKLEVPQAGANWSNSATFVQKALNKINTSMAAVVGSAVGHLAGLPLGAAELAGFGGTKAIGAINNAKQVRQIAKQMPIVSQTMQQWQKAVVSANKANSPQSGAVVSLASTNLARALAPFGADFNTTFNHLQGLATGRADQQQQ